MERNSTWIMFCEFLCPLQRTGICTSNNKARVESAWFTVAVILQNNPPFLRIQPVVHTQKKKRFAGKQKNKTPVRRGLPYASASSIPHPCPSHAILAPSPPPPHLRHLAAAAAPLHNCEERRGGEAKPAAALQGPAVARSSRTCRISPDPVGSGAQTVDLQGRRPELGAGRLAGAAWCRVTVREERDERERKGST